MSWGEATDLLDWFKSCATHSPVRERCTVIAHQHLLPSIVPLLRNIVECIGTVDRVHVLGKPYSSMSRTVGDLRKLGVRTYSNRNEYQRGRYHNDIKGDIDSLWLAVAQVDDLEQTDRIVLLDEGGFLSASVPESLRRKTVAVEQTTSGISQSENRSVPVIQVAVSAAKKAFESPFIAAAIWDRFVREQHPQSADVIGVLGLGSIGTALAEKSRQCGFKVIGFDSRSVSSGTRPTIQYAWNAQDLIETCDILFGCTGVNWIGDIPQGTSWNPRMLVSTSSGDIEFAGLLLDQQATVPYERLLDDVLISNDCITATLLNGGFPFNFNREFELESVTDIALTRALMLAGFQQALKLDLRGVISNFSIPLDPYRQMGIVGQWRKLARGVSPRVRLTEPFVWGNSIPHNAIP